MWEPDARESAPRESAADRAWREAEDVLAVAIRFPEPRPTRWRRAGLTRRGERVLDVVGVLLLFLLLSGWGWSVNEARSTTPEFAPDPTRERFGLSPVGARLSASLSQPGVPAAAYLTEAALAAVTPHRGQSGRLRAVIVDPDAPLELDELEEGTTIGFLDHGEVVADSAMFTGPARAPRQSGIWRIVLGIAGAVRPVGEFSVITRRPLADRQRGYVGRYFIGTWPTERRAHSGYRTPSGFIEVTLQNRDTYVSEHFRLRDFLTKGQEQVWPKYLVLDMRLVDKLELVLADLAARGIDVSGVRVMSGFRTPQYNSSGGNTAGRAALSRHMYGDAADIYIDSDDNGVMDDLNGDGRVNIEDARVVAAAAERVEKRFPSLIGGIGIYRAGPGHGPFVHVDTRGYRARW